MISYISISFGKMPNFLENSSLNPLVGLDFTISECVLPSNSKTTRNIFDAKFSPFLHANWILFIVISPVIDRRFWKNWMLSHSGISSGVIWDILRHLLKVMKIELNWTVFETKLSHFITKDSLLVFVYTPREYFKKHSFLLQPITWKKSLEFIRIVGQYETMLCSNNISVWKYHPHSARTAILPWLCATQFHSKND